MHVGDTVYLKVVPLEWVIAGDVDFETQLLVVRVGRRNAVVARKDGGSFPFPRRSYRLLRVPLDKLAPAA